MRMMQIHYTLVNKPPKKRTRWKIIWWRLNISCVFMIKYLCKITRANNISFKYVLYISDTKWVYTFRNTYTIPIRNGEILILDVCYKRRLDIGCTLAIQIDCQPLQYILIYRGLLILCCLSEQYVFSTKERVIRTTQINYFYKFCAWINIL